MVMFLQVSSRWPPGDPACAAEALHEVRLVGAAGCSFGFAALRLKAGPGCCSTWYAILKRSLSRAINAGAKPLMSGGAVLGGVLATISYRAESAHFGDPFICGCSGLFQSLKQ